MLRFAEPHIYTPVDDSLVLWISGRGRGLGSKVFDLSGKGNHGTIYGATWKNTPLGHSVLSFDGVDDYCFSKDTEVLTRRGWKKVSEVSYKDEIATLNPKIDELEYQRPSRLFNFEYTGEMCHFYGRHLDLLVTPDHNVYVSRYKSGADWHPYRLEKAKDVLKEFIRFKKDCRWIGKRKDIFILPAIENYKEKQLPMDLWLKFFGWWLSEGCIREQQNLKTKSTYYQVIISQSNVNAENCKEIEKTIESLGWKWSHSGCSYYIWSGYNKQLIQYLKQFGKAESKFIPEGLKELPPEQLEILYSALMKGDGHRNQYYTKSKRLADDVQELCLKLGYSADISYWENRKYPIYVVGLEKTNTQPRINEHRSNREVYAKGELVSYNGRVYGITVPKYHIIYVRRNGKACWTGNCDCGNSENLKNLVSYTFETWLNMSNPGSNYDPIFLKQIKSSSDIEIYGGNGGISISHNRNNGGTFKYVYANNIPANQWVYYVVTYGSGILKTYINGVNDQTFTGCPDPLTHQYSVNIGRTITFTTSYLRGSIAEVRIHNRALSAEEIKERFNMTKHLYGIWNMELGW